MRRDAIHVPHKFWLKLYSLNTFVFIWVDEWNQTDEKKIHELHTHENE